MGEGERGREGLANLAETIDDNNNKSDGLYVGIIEIGFLSRKSVNRLWEAVSIRTEVRRLFGLIAGGAGRLEGAGRADRVCATEEGQ